MGEDLISNALETICNLANAYLENLDRIGDAWISLTSLVDHNGTLNQEARDKIVMCVYNITRETTISTYQSTVSKGGGGDDSSLSVVSPPLFIDVHLMFMANFTEKNYRDGLAALSRLIGY
ncbi:MAG: Pvc16 family protein, partial [Novosphingobium sp.]